MNEQKQIDEKDTAVFRLWVDFIEQWNDENPRDVLNSDLQIKFMQYLEMAHGLGWDSCYNKLKECIRLLEQKNYTINSTALKCAMEID